MSIFDKGDTKTKETAQQSDLSYDPKKIADENGWDLVLPRPDELFIDLDNEDLKLVVDAGISLLVNNGFPVSITRFTPSKTPGHFHVVLKVEDKRYVPIDPMTRIAIQACLGSDSRRELLSVLRVLKKLSRPPTCFFEACG